MSEKNIILIGFMGSGKTLVSIELENILNKQRISTDDLIEEREGKSITQIFKDEGESYFRQCEAEVVAEIASQSNLIVDCGGGIVLDPENIELLRQNGVVINLSVEPESVLENIKGKTHRPLLDVENPLEKIRELLDERRPLYANADCHVVSDNKTIEELTNDVLKVVENE